MRRGWEGPRKVYPIRKGGRQSRPIMASKGELDILNCLMDDR